MRDLAEINNHIKPEEISALEFRESEFAEVIASARVRLDAVRLIWKAPTNRFRTLMDLAARHCNSLLG